jgi:hypothetical protein
MKRASSGDAFTFKRQAVSKRGPADPTAKQLERRPFKGTAFV